MRWLPVLLLVALATVPACSSERASAEQCRFIFNRLVTLELEEMGFDDPALAERRQAELAARYRHELTSCVRRQIPEGAMRCVTTAKNTEAISHHCLR